MVITVIYFDVYCLKTLAPESFSQQGSFTSLCIISGSHFSRGVAKEEPPDNWDEDEQQEKEEKEKLRRTDKDLEFLLQQISRDTSLDDFLKSDLQSKKSDSKYKEMLVGIPTHTG